MPAPQIFKTANEAILEARNSPSRATSSMSPCQAVQRKRGREEVDDDPATNDPVRRLLFTSTGPAVDADGDVGMEEVKGDDEDEEDLEVFLGHNNGLPNRHNRPIKPLRKGSPEMYIPPPSQSMKQCDSTQPARATSNGDLTFVSPVLSSAISDITMHMRMAVDGSNNEQHHTLPVLTPDMFNQPF